MAFLAWNTYSTVKDSLYYWTANSILAFFAEQVKIKVGGSCHLDLIIDLPILIGTVPLLTGPTAYLPRITQTSLLSTGTDQAREGLPPVPEAGYSPTAPPAYSDLRKLTHRQNPSTPELNPE